MIGCRVEIRQLLRSAEEVRAATFHRTGTLQAYSLASLWQ